MSALDKCVMPIIDIVDYSKVGKTRHKRKDIVKVNPITLKIEDETKEIHRRKRIRSSSDEAEETLRAELSKVGEEEMESYCD